MSSFRATGWPAVLLIVNTHVTRVRSSRAHVGVFTHVSMHVAPLSLHAPPAVDCPRNDDRAADGGAFMYLY